MFSYNAFSSLSTHKLKDSLDFYRNVLGLEVEEKNDKFLHIHLPGGQVLVLYEKEEHHPSTSTVLNFQVHNIKSKVAALSKRGVLFIQYDPPFQTDDIGISWDDQGSHLAWFKDPGGNILSLIEN